MSHSVDESDSHADLASLCRRIAIRCARVCRCSHCDSEDFSQDFTLGVLDSADVVTLLELSHDRRCALLGRMAHFDCIDFMRSLQRTQGIESLSLQCTDRDDAPWLPDLVDLRGDPVAAHEREALQQALREAIDNLLPSARLVMVYHYQEHLPVAAIATRTGRTAVAIRQCLYASRLTVRSRLISGGWTEADACEVMRAGRDTCFGHELFRPRPG
jgi:RNA polymerase sigma factor (sigma-70 family)